MSEGWSTLLKAGETVLWEGKPSLEAPVTLKDKFTRATLFSMGLLTAILAIGFWLGNLSDVDFVTKTPLILFYVIFSPGIATILIAASLFPRKWAFAILHSDDIYAITTSRALVISQRPAKTSSEVYFKITKQWPLDRSKWPQKTANSVMFEYDSTFLRSIFGTEPTDRTRHNVGFEMLEDADTAYSTLTTQLDKMRYA